MTSMETASLGTYQLHVALCEIERGLFCATYPDREPGFDRMPRYQLGDSVADAKGRIERYAERCGFRAVIWNDGDASVGSVFSCGELPAGDAGGAHSLG